LKWTQISVTTVAEQVEILEPLFWDAGAVSVTMTDAGDIDLLEPGPGETPLWDKLIVTALFEDDVEIDAIEKSLYSAHFDNFIIDELADQDWERAWLERFRPMKFGERLWVCPSGYEVSDAGAIVIQLDPGLAFGTGTHATTHLCLQWLDEFFEPGLQVLDYGCGSGILAIGSLLLGAAHAVAIDNDPQALAATGANAERNGVTSRLEVRSSELPLEQKFDVVLANILAQPLSDLAPHIQNLLSPGGHLVMSGIMENQVDWVKRAYTEIAFRKTTIVDGWARLHGVRE
jgi:ribosomal protein L11 methyltransferase